MKVKFSRCTSANLSSIPREDGQIIFVKDTNEQYVDTKTKRCKITDMVFVNSLEDVEEPLSSKLYYATSENTIGVYVKGDWQKIYNCNIDIETILTKDNETPYTPTNDYNPATKKYVDDSVKATKNYFKRVFNDTDWILNGQQYEITIPQSEHRLVSPYIVSLEMKSDSEEYKAISVYGSSLLPNGSIVLISDIQYNGRILLKGNDD